MVESRTGASLDLQRPKTFYKPNHYCERERAQSLKQAWCSASHSMKVSAPQSGLGPIEEGRCTISSTLPLDLESLRLVQGLPVGRAFVA